MGEKDNYIALLAEQYRLLVSAGVQASQHAYTALQWGTAVVGLVLGAAISQWTKVDGVVEFAFLLAIPSLAAMGMLLWLGELVRIDRLADFICAVESKFDLALKHPDGDGQGQWFDSFSKEWSSDRTHLLSALEIEMPVGSDGPVAIGSGPVTFERWLREIRARRAGKNLAWVYLVRLLLFPAVMLASWATGLYYALFQSRSPHLPLQAIAAMAVGLLIGIFTTWLAAEIVSTMRHGSSHGSSYDYRPRRYFRRLLARPLQISEWKQAAASPRSKAQS